MDSALAVAGIANRKIVSHRYNNENLEVFIVVSCIPGSRRLTAASSSVIHDDCAGTTVIHTASRSDVVNIASVRFLHPGYAALLRMTVQHGFLLQRDQSRYWQSNPRWIVGLKTWQ
jgi:hypothetical protein